MHTLKFACRFKVCALEWFHIALHKCAAELQMFWSRNKYDESVKGKVALLPITQRPLVACYCRNSGCLPSTLLTESFNCFPRQHQYLRTPCAPQRLCCKRLVVAAVVLRHHWKRQRRGRMSQGRRAGDQSSPAALSPRYSGTWSPRSMQTKESTFLSRTRGESVPSTTSKHVVFFQSQPRALLLLLSSCPSCSPWHILSFTPGASTAVVQECSRVSRWRHSQECK